MMVTSTRVVLENLLFNILRPWFELTVESGSITSTLSSQTLKKGNISLYQKINIKTRPQLEKLITTTIKQNRVGFLLHQCN